MVSVKKTDTNNRISVKSTKETNVFGIKDNLSEYYARQAEHWAHSEEMVNGTDYSSKYYAKKSKESANKAEIHKNNTIEAISGFQEKVQVAKDNIEQSRINSINAIDNTYSTAVGNMQEKGGEVLTSIEASKAEAIDSINSTKTTIINDIEFVADGEKQEIEDLVDLIKENAEEIASRTSFAMFDTVLKDYILTYEESKGLALQGTYVYKEAIAGSRYGYPDFYNKCLKEYENSTNEQAYAKSNITKVGSVVDNQGVLSGFSSSNYVQIPNFIATKSDTIEFVFKLNTGSSVASNTWFFCGFPIQFYQTHLNLAGVGDIGTYAYSVNTDYYIKIVYANQTISAYYSTDGKAYTADGSKSYTGNLGSNVQLGYIAGYNSALAGTIDLNESYININGVRWWTGVNTLEYKKNLNGHLFYNIAQKDKVDEVFASTGSAWFYGIDTENERIFLPRNNWFDQVTGDILEVGNSIEAGLPNITGVFVPSQADNGGWAAFGASSSKSISGAFYLDSVANRICLTETNNGWSGGRLCLDASRSSTVYGKSSTVQPNAVKKLLYICVGNVVAESSVTDVIDVTTTENDTTPLGYHFYQAGAQPSVSYLKSEGQWNDGNIYTTFYNEFVQKLGQDFACGKVVSHTEEYTDYDLVINQDDMTFRLPLLDGSETIPDYQNYTEKTAVGSYVAERNCVVSYFSGTTTGNGAGGALTVDNIMVGQLTTTNATVNASKIAFVKRGHTYALGSTATFHHCKIFPCIGNGSLYFKVANAVQNLELLDAGEVLEGLANVIPDNSSLISNYAMPSNRYIDLELGASGTIYTAPANGYVVTRSNTTGTWSYLHIYNPETFLGNTTVYTLSNVKYLFQSLPIKKGNIFRLDYDQRTFDVFGFVYAEGEQ